MLLLAQSAWAAEYTDCISAKGYDSTNECPVYDTKQSDGEISVMLRGIRSTPLLWLLPGPLRPGVVIPDMVEQNETVNCRIVWN